MNGRLLIDGKQFKDTQLSFLSNFKFVTRRCYYHDSITQRIKKEEHLQFYFENVKNVSILIQFKHFGSNLNSAQVHYTILQFLRTSYSKNASDFRCLDFLIINKAF